MERLRRLCRAATIIIPPNAYRAAKAGGGEAALAAALEALLAKHDLDKGSDKAATDAVRARLQLQKDLDGAQPLVSHIRNTVAVRCCTSLDPGCPLAESSHVVWTLCSLCHEQKTHCTLPCCRWGSELRVPNLFCRHGCGQHRGGRAAARGGAPRAQLRGNDGAGLRRL